MRVSGECGLCERGSVDINDIVSASAFRLEQILSVVSLDKLSKTPFDHSATSKQLPGD